MALVGRLACIGARPLQARSGWLVQGGYLELTSGPKRFQTLAPPSRHLRLLAPHSRHLRLTCASRHLRLPVPDTCASLPDTCASLAQWLFLRVDVIMQRARNGGSTQGMPQLEVVRGTNRKLMICDGSVPQGRIQ